MLLYSLKTTRILPTDPRRLNTQFTTTLLQQDREPSRYRPLYETDPTTNKTNLDVAQISSLIHHSCCTASIPKAETLTAFLQS
jgi:hypothetical protein